MLKSKTLIIIKHKFSVLHHPETLSTIDTCRIASPFQNKNNDITYLLITANYAALYLLRRAAAAVTLSSFNLKSFNNETILCGQGNFSIDFLHLRPLTPRNANAICDLLFRLQGCETAMTKSLIQLVTSSCIIDEIIETSTHATTSLTSTTVIMMLILFIWEIFGKV